MLEWCLLLGGNKRLELSTLFIQAGREIAVATGWYGERRGRQMVFGLGLAVVMISALLRVIWKRRRFFRQHPLALAGSALLVLYVLLRAAFIDHVDQMLGFDLEKIPFLWLLEAGGLLLIMVHALRNPK